MKLTPLAKALITIIVLGAVGTGIYSQRDKLFPGKKPQASSVPPKADLPDVANTTKPVQVATKPGCADKPEVRLYHWAWNAQMGLMYATGGKQAAEGSLMCKHGVNLNNFDPRLQESVQVRRFDGADTWTFID